MFTKATTRQLMSDVIGELQTLAASRGLTIEGAGGTFSHGDVTLKIKVTARDASGIPVNFANHAELLGLPSDCHGSAFISHGGKYRIVGIKLRNRKYPIIAERWDDAPGGSRFKFPVEAVRRGGRATVSLSTLVDLAIDGGEA